MMQQMEETVATDWLSPFSQIPIWDKGGYDNGEDHRNDDNSGIRIAPYDNKNYDPWMPPFQGHDSVSEVLLPLAPDFLDIKLEETEEGNRNSATSLYEDVNEMCVWVSSVLLNEVVPVPSSRDEEQKVSTSDIKREIEDPQDIWKLDNGEFITVPIQILSSKEKLEKRNKPVRASLPVKRSFKKRAVPLYQMTREQCNDAEWSRVKKAINAKKFHERRKSQAKQKSDSKDDIRDIIQFFWQVPAAKRKALRFPQLMRKLKEYL